MSWWNPVDWAKDAWNDIHGVPQDVGKWVEKWVKAAVSSLARDLDDFVGIVDYGLDEVGLAANEAYGEAVSALDWVRTEGSHLLADAQDYAGSLVHQAVRDLEKAGGEIEHIAGVAVADFHRDVLNPAIHDLEAATDLVRHDLAHEIDSVAGNLGGLAHSVTTRLDTAYDQIEHYADVGLSAFDRDVVDPIGHDLAVLARDAVKVDDHVWHETLAAVHLVEASWDWLELMALHGVSAIEELPAEIAARLSPAAVRDYVAHELRADVRTAETFVEEWWSS